MSAISAAALKSAVVYPDSDGEPMSDNTLQFDWIAILKWGAEAQFRTDPNIFVAGNHLIYPIEGDPLTRQGPDVFIAFGRPKGYRGSYRVWEEADTFPQVIFEVRSPSNRSAEMEKKRLFYEEYGAEEYYYIHPGFPANVEGWRLDKGRLTEVPEMNGFTSPRLGWRFEFIRGQLMISGRDGRLLQKPDEIAAERDEAALRAEKLAAKLRELGLDPDNL